MSKPWVIFCTVLVAGVSSISGSTEARVPGMGEKELGGSFLLSFEDGRGTVLLEPRIGFFLDKGVELEGKLLLSHQSNALSTTRVGLLGDAQYHFELQGPIVPFVLGGLGFEVESRSNHVSGSDTYLILTLGGGIKPFITRSAAIRIEYGLGIVFGDGTSIRNTVLAGLSLFI